MIKELNIIFMSETTNAEWAKVKKDSDKIKAILTYAIRNDNLDESYECLQLESEEMAVLIGDWLKPLQIEAVKESILPPVNELLNKHAEDRKEVMLKNMTMRFASLKKWAEE